jgi:hypothetical protein
MYLISWAYQYIECRRNRQWLFKPVNVHKNLKTHEDPINGKNEPRKSMAAQGF